MIRTVGSVRDWTATALVAVALVGCGPTAPGGMALGDSFSVVEEGATYPTVAVSGLTGHAFVAWVGMEGDRYDVYLASAAPGSEAFSPPVRVNDVPGDAAPHEQAPAQVVVGADDEVYVLWQNNTMIEGRRFPASDLRLAVSTDGGRTFAPTITVNDDAGGPPSSHTFHSMAVGPDGSLYVAWIDSREQDRLREAGRGGGPDDPGQEIRVARSLDGGRSFSGSVTVDRNSCPCCRTALAVGPDGAAYVAWRKLYPGDVRDVVVARAEPGTLDFGGPVRVHGDDWVFPGCPHAGPSIRADTEGRLHVGWYTGKEGRQGLWYTSSADGGRTFSGATPILTAEFVPPSQVALAPVGDGVALGWEDRTGASGSIAFAATPAGASRSGLRGISTGAGRSPAFDAGAGGGLLAWLEGEAIRARWVAAR
jgi:hypothetical protein